MHNPITTIRNAASNPLRPLPPGEGWGMGTYTSGRPFSLEGEGWDEGGYN